MRYRIKKKLSRYQVVTHDGRPVGEHNSPQAARSHLKALRSGVKAPETAAGRRALDSASFVLSQERKFPVTSPQDVKDAVSSWGRYRGPTSFDTFKHNLIDLAKRKGFASALPKVWGIETKDVATIPSGNYGSGPGGLFANPALGGVSRPRKRTKATRTPADSDLWGKALAAAGRRYTIAKSAAAMSWAADWYTQHGGTWVEDAGITTKPGAKYRSIQNPRAYRALRRQGHSKEAAARISNAQAPGHTVKAKRIAGNLGRADDGQFTAMGGGDESAPDQKPAKPPKKAPKPPKATDPAKEAQRQQDADYRALRRQQVLQDREERRARQAQRETERQADREQRAADRVARRAEVLQRRADREAARKKREEEKPKGGGGGGGGKKDEGAGGADKLDQQLAELRRLASAYGRRTKADVAPVSSTFTVFKDARGQSRWLAQTTTAYEDRDNEVLASAALAADVARVDRDGLYGPLRWWHVGNPDSRNLAAPWGPGLDLGMCDFNAMSGRTLIESGTFKSERIAQWAAVNADKLGLSPGFFHPTTEPDPDGVFRHIRRFERSLAPRERVSNPYTALHITRTTHKESPSVDTEKIKALKTLGLADEIIDSLLASAQQTEKTAVAAGVRYKTNDAPAEVTIGGVVYALKAPPTALIDDETQEEPAIVAKAPEDEETLLQDSADEAEGDAEEASDLLDMTRDEFRQELRAACVEALAPILAQLKLSEKMEGSVKGLMEEMKTAFGGTATKTVDALTALKEATDNKIATLKAQIAELESGRTAVQTGHRASAADSSVTTKAAELAVESQPQPLSELAETLRWASQTATGAFGGAATNGSVIPAPDTGGFLGQPAQRQ